MSFLCVFVVQERVLDGLQQMNSSIQAPRRLSAHNKENLHSHPLPALPSKPEEPPFRKKTEQGIFLYGHGQAPGEQGREVIVDELTLHIHHDPAAHPPHPHHEHYLGEEALVPIALDNLKMALETRLRHLPHG